MLGPNPQVASASLMDKNMNIWFRRRTRSHNSLDCLLMHGGFDAVRSPPLWSTQVNAEHLWYSLATGRRVPITKVIRVDSNFFVIICDKH